MKLLIFAALAAVCFAAEDPWTAYNGHSLEVCLSETEFKELWHVFDTNHDGIVTHLEFDTAFEDLHFHSHDQTDRLFSDLDRVTDGRLDDDDFHHIFRFFDINGDSCVDHDEWTRVWRGLGMA